MASLHHRHQVSHLSVTPPGPARLSECGNSITTLKKGANQASPGRAKAFYPNTQRTNQKPQIIVGGDGAEIAFLLHPNSEDASDWSYTREDIINVGCTVGQVEVGDTDGDGFVEFFVPAFEDNTVFAYTYSPAPSA